MLGKRKNFNKSFARVSPVFVALGFALLGFSFSPSASAATTPRRTTAVKREAAGAQFARAEEQRAALNSKPIEKRTLAEYKQVVASYRRVYLITPRAAEVQDALLSVAELYSEMGDRFGRSYYQSAVIPTNSFCANTRRAAIPKMRFCGSGSCKEIRWAMRRRPQRPMKSF